MQTVFMELPLNVGVKQRNVATLSVLHSVHDAGGTPPYNFLECTENLGWI